jgi:hypothetical protein
MESLSDFLSVFNDSGFEFDVYFLFDESKFTQTAYLKVKNIKQLKSTVQTFFNHVRRIVLSRTFATNKNFSIIELNVWFVENSISEHMLYKSSGYVGSNKVISDKLISLFFEPDELFSLLELNFKQNNYLDFVDFSSNIEFFNDYGFKIVCLENGEKNIVNVSKPCSQLSMVKSQRDTAIRLINDTLNSNGGVLSSQGGVFPPDTDFYIKNNLNKSLLKFFYEFKSIKYFELEVYHKWFTTNGVSGFQDVIETEFSEPTSYQLSAEKSINENTLISDVDIPCTCKSIIDFVVKLNPLPTTIKKILNVDMNLIEMQGFITPTLFDDFILYRNSLTSLLNNGYEVESTDKRDSVELSYNEVNKFKPSDIPAQDWSKIYSFVNSFAEISDAEFERKVIIQIKNYYLVTSSFTDEIVDDFEYFKSEADWYYPGNYLRQLKYLKDECKKRVVTIRHRDSPSNFKVEPLLKQIVNKHSDDETKNVEAIPKEVMVLIMDRANVAYFDDQEMYESYVEEEKNAVLTIQKLKPIGILEWIWEGITDFDEEHYDIDFSIQLTKVKDRLYYFNKIESFAFSVGYEVLKEYKSLVRIEYPNDYKNQFERLQEICDEFNSLSVVNDVSVEQVNEIISIEPLLSSDNECLTPIAQDVSVENTSNKFSGIYNYISKANLTLKFEKLNSFNAFESESINNEIIVYFNTDHSLYNDVYLCLSDESKQLMIMLLSSLCHISELNYSEKARVHDRNLFSRWSEYIENHIGEFFGE